MEGVVVHSFAHALPERIVTNDDLAKLMDTSDEWITKRSGIKTRRWVTPGTGSSDLAVNAARATLKRADISAVDAIVAATLSPDYEFPGIGVLIQHKLGLPTIPAYDVRLQCSGFLYGLEMAAALVRSGIYKRILLVGAEVHSTGLDLTTRGRDVSVLFGDGAGSCIVERRESFSAPSRAFDLLGTELHSEGAHAADLWCQHPSSKVPRGEITKQQIDEGIFFATMNGRKVFEAAVRRMTEVSLSILGAHGLTPGDISLMVPHQANLRINLMVAEQLGLRPDQVFNTIEKYGDTTAATIPIGMSEAIAADRIMAGTIILQAAFGSGFTWGAALLRAQGDRKSG